MNKSTQQALINVAIYAGGAFVVYKILSKIFSKTSDYTDKNIAAPIGQGYASLTMSSAIESNTKIRLPNGALIDPVNGAFSRAGDVTKWFYNGKQYTLGPRASDGYYPAN